MIQISWRGGVAALGAVLAAACAPGGRPSADSARMDTTVAAAPAATSSARPATSASPDSTAPRVGSAEKPPTDKVVGSAGHASGAAGARVTGGPQRQPIPPRSSGCGGTYVNVTVKASALGGTTLERVAGEVLAPVRGDVGSPTLSPAIRAFRVSVRDPAAADRVVSRLRASPAVEAAERDPCEKVIESR
jgi:hypothetical protein